MPCARRAIARVCIAAALSVLAACAGDDSTGVGTEKKPIVTTLTVRLAKKTDSLGVGESRALVAQVVDQDGVARPASIAWMSLNGIVASVDAAGNVTGITPGLARIVATIGPSADTAQLFVRAGALVVEPSAIITAVGEQIQLAAVTRTGEALAASGAAVSWRSSDPSIATVDADGTVSAVGAGDVTVTASAGTQQGSAVLTVRQKDIASLRIEPVTSSVYPGATQQLVVSGYDDGGRALPLDASTVKWSSSNTTIATVDASGLATGVAKGAAIVTARVGSKTATATLNVLAVPVASVGVALATSTLEVGQTTQANATLKDASGNTITGTTIAWQSSNPAIATVNTSGTVTAVARGSATISAISDGKNGGAALTVAAKTVASVAVSPNPASATVGRTAQLTATATDAGGVMLPGKTFTWTSANTAIATVSPSGLVTAVAPGGTDITATSEGVSGQVAFTATAVTAARVEVTPESPNVQVGSEVQLAAAAYDAGGTLLSSRAPSWSTSNSAVATVSSSGRVTGVGKGTATITATVDGKSDAATVSVTEQPPAPVASVSVSLSAQSINVGGTAQATAVLRDANGVVLTGRTVTWSSAAPELASVSSNGTVTGVAAGTATIVATAEGVSANASLIVQSAALAPVASIELKATSTTMYVGQTQTLTVTLRDAQGNVLTGRTITFSSYNLSIAAVSPSGLLQAVGVGDVAITAKSEGKIASLPFTVTSAPVAPVATVNLTATTTSISVGQSTQLFAVLRDANGNPVTGSVSWSSSAPGVASVSGSGLVTGVSAGTAMINATSGGKTGSLAITVTAGSGTVASVAVSLASSALTVGQSAQAAAVAKDASGNTVSGTPSWSSSNTAVATVSASGLVAAVGAGQANIVATVSGKTGSASVSVTTSVSSSPVTPAELPRSVPSATAPAPTGRTIRVAAGGDLQAALNSAQQGDVVALASGATFTGNFLLPPKSCAGWVTIRTDIDDSQLPATGQRITPSYASKLAKIMTADNQPALRASMPTCGWRIFGVEIAVAPSFTGLQYWLMALGDGGWAGGGEQQTSLDKVPSNIILDRVYLHGQSTSNLIRCLALNSANTAIVNSWISDCHARGFDSQAIEGWNGPGPYLIENNQIEGAGENIMFGGADPAIQGLSPSDITIRGNHVRKDPSWKGVWTVKNLFELKHARRILVEGNVFENNWADAQAGMAIVIKSSNDGGTAPWQGTTDFTFRYNVVRNSPRGFNAQAVDGATDTHVARVRVEHNLFENIGTYNGTGGDGWLMLLTHDLKDVAILNNTFVHNTTNFGMALMMDYADGQARNIAILDNVFTNPNGYAVMYSGAQVGSKSLDALASSYWSFDRNVVVGVEETFVSWHPQGSWYPRTLSDVGFVNPGGGNYRFSSSSPYKGRGAGGRDPGADLDEVARRTATARGVAASSVASR